MTRSLLEVHKQVEKEKGKKGGMERRRQWLSLIDESMVWMSTLINPKFHNLLSSTLQYRICTLEPISCASNP